MGLDHVHDNRVVEDARARRGLEVDATVRPETGIAGEVVVAEDGEGREPDRDPALEVPGDIVPEDRVPRRKVERDPVLVPGDRVVVHGVLGGPRPGEDPVVVVRDDVSKNHVVGGLVELDPHAIPGDVVVRDPDVALNLDHDPSARVPRWIASIR